MNLQWFLAILRFKKIKPQVILGLYFGKVLAINN